MSVEESLVIDSLPVVADRDDEHVEGFETLFLETVRSLGQEVVARPPQDH